MRNSLYKKIALLLILMLAGAWLAGCGMPEPTEQAAVEPTAPTQASVTQVSVTQAPTATSIPPSPRPLPTATAVLPSPTVAPTPTTVLPTPTPQGHAPVIVNLQDQSISDGERFPRLKLSEHVTDEDHGVDEIDWQISGSEELEVRTLGDNLIVALPFVDWTGSETLHLEACDPDGLCAAQDVVFTVRAENDAPVVSASGQIIMAGETFAPIDLDDIVYDEDNAAEELAWTVTGGADLGVAVEDGVATVELPRADWRGREIVRFEACDPEGACGAREATFRVMDRTDAQAKITYIRNAGFMITIGDKKILIDALIEEPALPTEITEALLTAQPPFDDVDLILTTHSHSDHFDAEEVASHLEHNPNAVYVAPRDAASAVNQLADVGERIIPINLQQRAGEKTQLAVDGIGLECIYLSHGVSILNLGYVITTEGRRFFHTGDIDPASVPVSELQGHGLPQKQIDVAFVPHFLLTEEGQQAHVTEGIQADHIVAMHYQFTAPPPDYELMERYFPEAIVFHAQMESWVLPGDVQSRTEQLRFQSGEFSMVGDLQVPATGGKHPVILMVHGDGRIDRTDGGKYRPLMERFLRAGYAVFSWDKPGTGESTGQLPYESEKVIKRAEILVDAIEFLKEHPAIDPERIGVWGISQAGCVIPLAMRMTDDITFMIVVGGPAMDAYDQGAYLQGQLAFCAGASQEEARLVEQRSSKRDKATTYQDYVDNATLLYDDPVFEGVAAYYGTNPEDWVIRSEAEWEPEDPDRPAFFNPIEVIEGTTIPVLAFFGELDRQVDPFQGAEAYEAALQRAGNPFYRVELIPGADHNIVLCETGCLEERDRRSWAGWRKYAPEYLDLMEAWLIQLSAGAD